MNPMARNQPGETLAETIAHVPDSQPGPRGFSEGGSSDLSEPRPRFQDRYIYSSGARPLDGYTIKRAIGRGGFGEVYYAVSDAGKEVALKLLLRNIDIERRGVQQCMNLKSPNLVTIFDMKTSDEGDTFVVMEYVSGPSLAQILAEYPEGMPLHEVRMWLKGLVEGVTYLHDHGIVHRDLKPANLFLEEGVVKIGDYGLSKAISHSQDLAHSSSVGTCHYMAPEIASGRYQQPIDIYALGVILFEMLTGRVPFQGETAQEVLMKHLTTHPDLSPLGEPYKSIVAKALAKDPVRRQQRVIELLPAEDQPAPPTVRFIGDGKTSPAGDLETLAANVSPDEPTPSTEPERKDKDEDLYHIGEEDPVFYIGPNTIPPRPRARCASFQQWLWGTGRRVARPGYGTQPAARRVAARPSIPTAPPPLPGGRIRLAELATSMLLAAPITAVLALPAAVAAGVDLRHGPAEVAILTGLALLGIWSILIPAKIWEGRQADAAIRRFTLGTAGIALGAMIVALMAWTNLEPPDARWQISAEAQQIWTDDFALNTRTTTILGLIGYFGLLFALGPWSTLTARDRKARFRVWPVLWTGLLAFGLSAVLPTPQPWGVALFVLMALVTQIVSPWSKEAAQYARRPKYLTA